MANNRKLYREALSVYGNVSQIEKTVEECAELIHAIQKSKEGLRTAIKIAAIAEEIADRNGISKSNGYVTLLKPEHPNSNKKGYVLRSHFVWGENTGRMIEKPEVIHHINGIKDDDRFENLRLFASDAEHQRVVHRMKGYFGVIRGGIIR